LKSYKDKLFVAIAGSSIIIPASSVYAEWVPIIAAADFEGVKTDVLTAVGAVMSIVLIVAGAGILIRMISRG